jgi:hypothetical protein
MPFDMQSVSTPFVERKPMSRANAATGFNGGAAAVLICALLALSGCNQNAPPAASAAVSAAPAAADAAATPTINASMTKVMSIHAQTIWDITSRAFNERGDGLAEEKVSATDWIELGLAGQHLRDRAIVLAEAADIVVAGPGETILGAAYAGRQGAIGRDWDAASAAQVQAKIAANRTLFNQRARTLAEAGDTLVKAARTKDIKALYGVSSNLDEVCDGCHERVWGTDEAPPFPKNK